MPFKEVPRKWPIDLKECQTCNNKEGDVAYGARGLCWPCYMRERARGTAEKFYKPTSSKVGSPLVQIARIVGKTELCARLDIDDQTLMNFISRKRLPRGMKDKIFENLDQVKAMHELGLKNIRKDPLPYREKEHRLRIWKSHDHGTGENP